MVAWSLCIAGSGLGVAACASNTVVDEEAPSLDEGVPDSAGGGDDRSRAADGSGAQSDSTTAADAPSATADSPVLLPDGGTVTSQDASGGEPSEAAPTVDAAEAASPPAWPDASPSAAGTKFPFPQHRSTARCVLANGSKPADVQAAYAQWKSDTVVDAGSGAYRVQRLESDPLNPDGCTPHGSTVSEGIGYGMLLAVYMNDQSVFDGLWLFEQQNLDSNGLMNWAPEGVPTNPAASECGGAATDADEDMAFALLMADQQWGGQGSLSKGYLTYAKQQITNIWNTEIRDSKLVAAGDGSWAGWSNVNISYFAPAYYRAFGKVDPTHNWAGADADAGSVVDGGSVLDTVYDTIDTALSSANGNQSNGLVPAWCSEANNACAATSNTDGPLPFYYQYDSCRTPFRIALDWCWNGEPRAQAYIAKTGAFFSGVGAKNIVDGYGLDGTPQPEHPADGGSLFQSAAFVGPAGVGAMGSASTQSFVDDAYANVATLKLLVGGTYYDDSWTAMSLLMMTGNFLDYSAYTGAY
jgi:hypothetical protein